MIKVYDFFSGCGGASCGFRKGGLKIELGLDSNSDAAATFRRNFPEAHFIEGDIRNISPEDIAPFIDRNHEVLFCGCAPCQPFSKQNKHKSSTDFRANLLAEFGRFVVAFLPDYIFVENVPGIQQFSVADSPLAAFIDLLLSLDYKTPIVQIVSAAQYGVPQQRKRLVLLAAKSRKLHFPKPTHGCDEHLKPYSTVGDWIYGLSPLIAGGVDPNDIDHASMRLSVKNLKRIRYTAEGAGRESWPEELVLECHKKFNGHSDVYGRLSFSKSASALTTKCISYSNGRFGHPVEDRAISLREAACLQTFPRDFHFEGSLISKAVQVGNAVPPLLAEKLSNAFSCDRARRCTISSGCLLCSKNQV